jgi:S1-C subfamily serine protease
MSTPTTPSPAVSAAAPTVSDPPNWRRWVLSLAALLIVFAAGYLLGRELERRNRYDTYWLLGATLAQDLDGVYFDYVYPGGPSELAGLQAGDRVGAIDGQPVTRAAQARRFIGEHDPGETVQITFRRGAYSDQASVLLGFLIVVYPEPDDPVVIIPDPIWPTNAPPPIRGTAQDARLGVYYRMLEAGDPFSVDNGALIITVWPGSPAEASGLAPGDIITEVEDHALSTSLTLEQALERYGQDDVISVRLVRADGTKTTIRVRWQ